MAAAKTRLDEYEAALKDAVSRMSVAKSKNDQSGFNAANKEAGEAQKRLDAERKRSPKSKSIVGALLGG